MSAAQLVRDLKGTWFGKSGMARCPAHDDRSPSLSIADGHDGKILVKCFAGCTGAAVIAALGHLGHWSNGPRGSYTAPREPAYMPGSDDAVRIRRALALWGEARDLDGTPGLTYLASRGVDIQALPNLRHALRWHPSCPWEGGPQGCILGIFTDILTGEPRAIHRTAIAPSGVQIGKKMLGPVAGCVIRLWPDRSNLGETALGIRLRACLVRWGLHHAPEP